MLCVTLLMVTLDATVLNVADRVGRKRVFLAGLVAFAAGSTWAAFSGSVGTLIAARASMGVGVALGPIVGGLLLTHFWWGSVFLINVPIAVTGPLTRCWTCGC